MRKSMGTGLESKIGETKKSSKKERLQQVRKPVKAKSTLQYEKRRKPIS